MLFANPAFYALAKRQRLTPGDGSLEGFSEQIVIHHEVPDVGDREGQFVAALAVFGARPEPAVFAGDPKQRRLLHGNLLPAAFEDERAGHHLVGIESLDARHVELLESALQPLQTHRSGLEGSAELELKVVGQSHARWRSAVLLQVVQEGESLLEAPEDDALVVLDLGKRKEFYSCVGDDSQIPLGSVEPATKVDADRLARRDTRSRQKAHRRGGGYVEHQIFDVSVAVLLHSTRVGRDPTAEGRKLDAVWFVAHRETVLRQDFDDLSTDRTGFDARHPILGVDPANSIHPRQVDGGDDSLLIGGAQERLRDIGASAVGDQARAVPERRSDQCLDLLNPVRVDDEIGDSRELPVFDGIDFLLGMPVAVSQPVFRVVADRVVGQKLPQLAEEGRVLAGFRNHRRVLRGIDFARIERNADHSADPGQEIRQLGTGQVVAIATQLDGAIRMDPKAAIREPPAVESLAVFGALPRRRGADSSAVVALTHRIGPREPFATGALSSRCDSGVGNARRVTRNTRPRGGDDTAPRIRR